MTEHQDHGERLAVLETNVEHMRRALEGQVEAAGAMGKAAAQAWMDGFHESFIRDTGIRLDALADSIDEMREALIHERVKRARIVAAIGCLMFAFGVFASMAGVRLGFWMP